MTTPTNEPRRADGTDQPVVRHLYEIYTGRTGESYERCYVWAEDEVEARMIFAKTHGDHARCVTVTWLFSSQSSSFCTAISDNGFVPNAERQSRREATYSERSCSPGGPTC